jgi:hypothetical protein
MAGGVEGERSRGELSSSQHPQPQQVESHQGSPAESVLASLRRENLHSEAWSHAEMVALIKREMAQYVERHRPSRFDPVAWMREQLTSQVAKSTTAYTEKNLDRQEGPHAKLLCAWDAVSLPYYTDAYTQGLARVSLQDDARVLGHHITLDSPESQLLDAMAEACKIPMTYGQVTIEGHDRPYTFHILKKPLRNDE